MIHPGEGKPGPRWTGEQTAAPSATGLAGSPPKPQRGVGGNSLEILVARQHRQIVPHTELGQERIGRAVRRCECDPREPAPGAAARRTAPISARALSWRAFVTAAYLVRSPLTSSALDQLGIDRKIGRHLCVSPHELSRRRNRSAVTCSNLRSGRVSNLPRRN